ncbi:MAG: class I SAM-dependent methyltransferase [Candidatus Aenigmatarchaeota archaeon]
MKKRFFEGGDYRAKDVFKALMPKYYPPKYKKYVEEETKLLKTKVKGANRVLEAGVGIGRLIPELAPLVREFVGIDNADLMLKKSGKAAKGFPNVRIVRGNMEELDKMFPENYFDFSLCVWNTLGNLKDEVHVLKQLAKVTSKSIFITVYQKGRIEDRKNWYKTIGVKLKRIDEENEIFYTESGLKSKSYDLDDIRKMAEAANLHVKDSRILADVTLWVELTKNI